MFLFPFVILALVLTLIGIPAIPLAAIVLAFGLFFGYVAAGRLVGERAIASLNGIESSPVVDTIVGLVILGLVGIVPILGGLIQGTAAVIGLGAVLTTKFGTGNPWFKKRARLAEGVA